MYNAWFVNPQTNVSYQIVGEVTTIGRNMANTIVLNDLTVSGQHARLMYHNGAFILYDLGARVPTRVNGYIIEMPTMLQNQDMVTFGQTTFRFIVNY